MNKTILSIFHSLSVMDVEQIERALGYSYTEIKEKYEGQDLAERTVTKKQVVPDVTAQIYWLKNRKPGDWRDKREPDDNTAIDRLDQILAGLKEAAEKE